MNPVPVPLEGSRERLSLIQMILLTHLKAGFEKRANCPCDCDAYRPNTLRGGGRIYLQKLTRRDFSFYLSPHIVIFAANH